MSTSKIFVNNVWQMHVMRVLIEPVTILIQLFCCMWSTQVGFLHAFCWIFKHALVLAMTIETHWSEATDDCAVGGFTVSSLIPQFADMHFHDSLGQQKTHWDLVPSAFHCKCFGCIIEQGCWVFLLQMLVMHGSQQMIQIESEHMTICFHKWIHPAAATLFSCLNTSINCQMGCQLRDFFCVWSSFFVTIEGCKLTWVAPWCAAANKTVTQSIVCLRIKCHNASGLWMCFWTSKCVING